MGGRGQHGDSLHGHSNAVHIPQVSAYLFHCTLTSSLARVGVVRPVSSHTPLVHRQHHVLWAEGYHESKPDRDARSV